MSSIKASRGTIFILSQNIIQFGIGLLFFTIAAGKLTKADIGLISTFTFISVLFVAIAPFSLQIAAARYIAEFLGQNAKETASSIVRTVRKWVSFLSLTFFGVGSILTFFLLSGVVSNPDLIVLVLVYGFFATMRTLYQAFLQGLQQFERYGLVGIVSILLSRGLGLLFLEVNFGLIGVVVGWIIGEAIGFLIGVLFYRGLLPKTRNYYDYKPLLSFSLPVLFMTVVNTVSDWTDRVFLFTDLEKLGVYELVIRGSSTLALIWIALSTTLLPIFSKSYGTSGKKDMASLTQLSIKYMIYLIAPAALGLASISKSALALLFGWEYTAGSTSLAILAIFSVLSSLSIIASTVLQAIGKTKVFPKITLTTIFVNIITSLLLIPRFGIDGAATARAAMMLTTFIYTFYELRREISIKIDTRSVVKTFLASMIMAIPLLLFDKFYSGIILTNAFLSVIIEIFLGISIYCVIMLLLKTLNKQDFELLKNTFPKPLANILAHFQDR